MNIPARDALLAQAFADQCRRWAAQSGAAADAAAAARQAGRALVEAMSAGNTCLLLEDDAPNLELLRASGIVGSPGCSAKPLILDAAGRLYLARYFEAEARLAAALLHRHRHPPPPPGPAARRMLQECFPDTARVDGQKLAVALALCRRFTVISGGPGTGKTTSVAQLLACLLADAPERRVLLAAPTGKAAARLQESLAACSRELPAHIAARMPRDASTLHRLLGFGAKGQAPRYHSGNPLDVETLVVDEASMLDLSLALQLCEALPAKARLVLLGDRNQLQAVEAGAVFATLSESAALTPDTRQQLAELTGWTAEALNVPPYNDMSGPLQDSVVWLRESYRFAGNSPLGSLSAALVEGNGEQALASFAENGDLRHLETQGPRLTPAEFDALRQGYAPYAAALADWRRNQSDPAPLFAAFNTFRALCVTRQGERGVARVNARLSAAFRETASDFGPSGLFCGQALMILKNDPTTHLFNGDIGIALADHQGFNVYFADANGNYRAIPPARLPAWEAAFAMTVHKSQGSEFQRVALVLPEKDIDLLTRELVYTAVTRARQGILLLGDGRLLLSAAARKTRRQSGFMKSAIPA
jgi:exodeoxyribonuclease V alpha subunit